MQFRGKLMMGNDSRQVEWNIAELLASGVKHVIFDLRDLDSIDSTGVGIIVMCHAKLQKAGGNLRIAGPQGIVLDTLVMTHVDRLVQFFPTAEEAAENFVAA
jgi:anti-anti-sigma factor